MEEGTNFGQIVAIFGAILIGLGFAWLVAQNWHSMIAPIKILILFVATAAAYGAGAWLRSRDHEKIGASLLILGSLLYTLSVFLIAQIYSTDSSLQGTAWLLLICWIGVSAIAYVFMSGGSIIVALLEFLVWLPMQYFAIIREGSPGLLALVLLGAGALFYGLALLHRAMAFERVYRGFAIIYLLLCAYLLSFQLLLPLLWSSQFSAPASVLVFAGVLLATGAIAFGLGAWRSHTSAKPLEIYGAFGVIALLALLVLLTIWPADAMGACQEKTCYDLHDAKSCAAAPGKLRCEWQATNAWTAQDGYCREQSCYNYNNQSSCEGAQINCSWSNYSGKAICADNTHGCAKLDEAHCTSPQCSWVGDACQAKTCYNTQNESDCNATGCYWNGNSCSDDRCDARFSQSDCSAKQGCSWSESYGSWACRDVSGCTALQNQHTACAANVQCAWRAGDSWSLRSQDMPLSAWIAWIAINLAFIAIIIAVIGFGTYLGSQALIYTGIGFFILDIVTRYIGFVMDLQGYNMLAIIFITGGLILVVGGYYIEKWRRKLIKLAQNSAGSR